MYNPNVRRGYRGDPYWLGTAFPTTCAGCGKPICSGEPSFYYPRGKKFYGDKCGCGKRAWHDFMTKAEEEDYYAGRLRQTRCRMTLEGPRKYVPTRGWNDYDRDPDTRDIVMANISDSGGGGWVRVDRDGFYRGMRKTKKSIKKGKKNKR